MSTPRRPRSKWAPLVVVDHHATDARAYRDRLTAAIRTYLVELSRFGQRIVVPKSRLRRTRWDTVGELDCSRRLPFRDDIAN